MPPGNLPIIHNYSHSPSVDAKPGYAYLAGTFYNRSVTWWEQTPAFNAYLGRCSLLLQQGLFVADALYYRGDDIGLGEPMKTRPALPAEGYEHDNCNLDALLTRVSVRDGRLVLPDGMSYRILVLPGNAAMAPEALAKVAELLKAGATVVGSRPTGMAGKSPGADARARFDAQVALLWGSAGVGEHRVVSDRTPAALLATLKVAPDFEFEGLSGGGDLDWIHRTAGGIEIYFVASRWDPEEKADVHFPRLRQAARTLGPGDGRNPRCSCFSSGKRAHDCAAGVRAARVRVRDFPQVDRCHRRRQRGLERTDHHAAGETRRYVGG